MAYSGCIANFRGIPQTSRDANRRGRIYAGFTGRFACIRIVILYNIIS
ncbi:MAG: hypothetical protein LBD58_10555 [Treponema sp.]|nr:hypothetical protein [Treponema sp.]